MDSHQSFSFVSCTNSSDSSSIVESKSPNSKLDDQKSFSSRMSVPSKEPMVGNERSIGILEVHIHQARDIHNICIYHKQDVYAKLCLTSDPEVTVQTKTINGGGKNPIFDETLRLDVRTTESSLKCEIWMLSRVRNYLEDQLLGFASVPLSDVLGNEKLPQEFSLSSTDLFHSPAGFVQLSLSYAGCLPEVLAIPAPTSSASPAASLVSSESNSSSIPSEFDKIEFLDLEMVKENQLMVSEYFRIPRTDLESRSTDSLSTFNNDDSLSLGVSVGVGQSFSSSSVDSLEVLKSDTPPTCVSTDGSPYKPASSTSVSGPSGASSNSPVLDSVSSEKEKHTDSLEGEAESSDGALSSDAVVQSVLNIKIDPEKSVVQQEIVDLYMKSMQQFSDSLAKMKLPLDIENGSPKKENSNSSSDEKLQASKVNGSRVFYGSRAFF